MESILKFLGTIALAIGSTILKGFVLTKLWAWFLVPFFGLPAIGIALAVGIATLVGLLAFQLPSFNEAENDNYLLNSIVYGYVFPLVALLVGFTASLFL